MSRLNLPHGNNSYKVENRKSKKKYQQTVRRIRVVSPDEEKEGYVGKDL